MDTEDLPTINKLIQGISKKIDEVKKEHGKIDSAKESYTVQLEQIESKKTKIRDSIAKLKKDKLEEKEAYYQALINFEVEQKLIKDIVWLEKTKQAYLERKARND